MGGGGGRVERLSGRRDVGRKKPAAHRFTTPASSDVRPRRYGIRNDADDSLIVCVAGGAPAAALPARRRPSRIRCESRRKTTK